MTPRSVLKAVFLDVGNTLVREEPSRFAIYAEAARARGVDVDERGMLALMRRAHAELPEEIDGAYRYSDPWFVAYIRRIFCHHLGLSGAHAASIASELFARFEDAHTFHLYPGAQTLIDECKRRGLVLGVISNWSARLPLVLAAIGLARSFDFVLCSALERREKPDPELFRAALRRARVAPDAALHAGDDLEKDGRGARALGIEAVLVDHADRFAEQGLDGISRVGDLPELTALILSRLQSPDGSR